MRKTKPTPAATEKVARDIPLPSAFRSASGKVTAREASAGNVHRVAARSARLQGSAPARAR